MIKSHPLRSVEFTIDFRMMFMVSDVGVNPIVLDLFIAFVVPSMSPIFA